ncbi:hypothetical protein GCM10009641_79790 [Mycobacterium cookii]|uniref:Uncharacterized protein n=1 Tax=Nocardioides furvisabuli TaxID=375542 RepID=A0ABN2XCA8_9ACTN
MLGTELNVACVLWNRDDIVEQENLRLEKKERRELRRREESG